MKTRRIASLAALLTGVCYVFSSVFVFAAAMPAATTTPSPSTPAAGGTSGAQDENELREIVAKRTELHSAVSSLNRVSFDSPQELIGRGLRFFTGLFGSIALVMIIYGGLQVMFASGQGDKVKSGFKIIIWAGIGLVTMMLSYLLVDFILRAIA